MSLTSIKPPDAMLHISPSRVGTIYHEGSCRLFMQALDHYRDLLVEPPECSVDPSILAPFSI
jgi:hypothetical protein